MFVTFFLGIIDLTTGEVEYSNAGHNPFILVRAENSEYQVMAPGMVLGAFEDIQYTNERLVLKPDDVIFMYTDGVTEAMNQQHKLFGEQRLLEIVGESGELPVTDLINSTLNGLTGFVDGYEQSDDITILALRFLASQQ